ncbi:MAG: response regulator [Sphingobacteriales bacterium]|nr:MAG: response regulator [Sphingobacteriales bacterium]
MNRKRIIVVEDDLVLLETIQDVLNSNGYECLGLYETENIFARMEQFKPDLFLVDYMLPDWNGGELCGAIRGIDVFEHTPIIIMSAYAKIISPMKEYGCNAVLEKPFNVKDLLYIVKSMLDTPVINSGLLPKIKTLVKGKSSK